MTHDLSKRKPLGQHLDDCCQEIAKLQLELDHKPTDTYCRYLNVAEPPAKPIVRSDTPLYTVSLALPVFRVQPLAQIRFKGLATFHVSIVCRGAAIHFVDSRDGATIFDLINFLDQYASYAGLEALQVVVKAYLDYKSGKLKKPRGVARRDRAPLECRGYRPPAVERIETEAALPLPQPMPIARLRSWQELNEATRQRLILDYFGVQKVLGLFVIAQLGDREICYSLDESNGSSI